MLLLYAQQLLSTPRHNIGLHEKILQARQKGLRFVEKVQLLARKVHFCWKNPHCVLKKNPLSMQNFTTGKTRYPIVVVQQHV